MELIFIFKFVHLIGASVLFGTGLGIAFFMLMAHRTGHPGVIAITARFVVIADFIFTATSVVVQPLSGFALASAIGLSPFEESWIVLSLAAVCAGRLVLAAGRFHSDSDAEPGARTRPSIQSRYPTNIGDCSGSGSGWAGRLSSASSAYSF